MTGLKNASSPPGALTSLACSVEVLGTAFSLRLAHAAIDSRLIDRWPHCAFEKAKQERHFQVLAKK
jgi:hypothetical protein